MTKSELIAKLMELNPHLSKLDFEKIVNVIFEEMIQALESGGRVELRGFGTFGIKKISARVGRNPKTGEKVKVEQKIKPFFKASKQLKLVLNDTCN